MAVEPPGGAPAATLPTRKQTGARARRLCDVQQGAASRPSSALEHVGRGLRRFADHRRQCGRRIQQHDQQHLSARLSAPTIASRPITIAGFSLAGGGTNFSVANGRHRPFRPVPGRRVRAPHRRSGLYLRRAGLWLAGRHHRPHRDRRRHRSVARAIQRQRLLRPRRRRLSLCHACDGGVGITPYAAGQFTTFDLPSYAERRRLRRRHLRAGLWRARA